MIFGVIHAYWFALPLVLVISVVYAASRHEAWEQIWRHAFRLWTMILGILVVTTAVLLLINSHV